MELVYLWVEDYKNIKKQGFNFSPRFECKFHDEYEKYIDDEGEEKERLKDNCKLEIKENDDYIENFFGENINVTAIVGKNGSGKSSIIQALTSSDNYCRFFDSNCQEINKNYFFNNNVIMLYDEDAENFLNKFNINEQIKDKLKISKYVFNNLSISFLFNSCQSFLTSFSFIPTHIKLTMLLTLGENDFINLRGNRYSMDNSYLDIEEHFTIDNQDISNLKKFIQNKLGSLNSDLKQYLYLREFIYKLNNNHTQAYIIAESIIKNCKFDDVSDINSYFQNKLEELYLENDEVIFLQIVNDIENIDKDMLNPDTFSINIKNQNLEKLLSNIQRGFFNIDFFKEERNGNIYFNMLSSGERRLISLFAKIFYIVRKLYRTENQKYFYILLDEPDIYLHPEWQKKLINIFDLFFSTTEIFKTKKINLIFTTHSPFLLSDIPKQNIIFLDTDENGNCKVVDGLTEKKQTFGANIHTLLSDSFFMKDGLMGEFAKGKINEIIDFHKVVEEENSDKEILKLEYLENQKKFWQTQSIVGESYLKQILENHLIEIEKKLLGKDEAKENKRERLLAQLKELDND